MHGLKITRQQKRTTIPTTARRVTETGHDVERMRGVQKYSPIQRNDMINVKRKVKGDRAVAE